MAHTFDVKVNSTRTNTNPKTFNHTCGAGSTLLVLTLVIGGATARTGTAPTYNGVAFTQADQARQAVASPETTVELWYYLNPPTGTSYQISIPNTNSVYITAESSSYKASAGNISYFRNAGYATNTSINPTGYLHTDLISGDIIVGTLGYGQDAASATVNYTSLFYTDDGTYISGAQYGLYTGSDNFLQWISSTNEDWVIVSAVFKEIANLSDGKVGASKIVAYEVVGPPGDVFVSKIVAYEVVGPPGDVFVSKIVAYEVVYPPGDVFISKIVAYEVVTLPMVISKVIAYAVLTVPDAINISKVVAYAVLSTEVSIAISKVVAYAVLQEQLPINIYKSLAYAVVTPPEELLITKSLGYVVVTPPEELLVYKSLGYAVIEDLPIGLMVTKSLAYSVIQYIDLRITKSLAYAVVEFIPPPVTSKPIMFFF